jgi:hypothetical protein
MREPDGAGGVINCSVHRGLDLVYSTAWVHYSGARLNIQRLDEWQQEQISSVGPHFSILFPHAKSVASNRVSGGFVSTGKNSLGFVHFRDGAAGRDGIESYDVSQLDVEYAYHDNGLDIRACLTLGEPKRETFCFEPNVRSNETYSINVKVPWEAFFEFWRISDPCLRSIYIKDATAAFGEPVAQLMVMNV